MTFEIEVKSFIPDKNAFDDVFARLQKIADFKETKELYTYMFITPYHLRVRLVKGQDTFFVTHKTGGYEDPARQETEVFIPLDQLDSFLHLLGCIGFEICMPFSTTRHVFSYEGCTLELSSLQEEGYFLEVELLTEDESLVKEKHAKVVAVMQKLELEIMPAQKIEKWMDDFYEKFQKPLKESVQWK